ncbi:hypothetical protein ABZ805_13770 [Saccharopolyspora sp. NPDC047091]|uniref:hypothetical protein n=1 Tax=Saccharopolyspora sp. NPDC047091 TaxID=3155924 RepID=UPI0034037297
MSGRALMWEVRAAPGAQPELLGWVREHAVPRCGAVEVYRSAEDRVVLIAHHDEDPPRLPSPPPHLVARPPHQWTFDRVG